MATDDDSLKTGGAMNVLSSVGDSEDSALLGSVVGEYRICELIAEGGMGRVYRAERIDGSFDRDVAIKISSGSGLNQELKERFVREQGFLAGLNHPNVSQLYDAGVTTEGWPYLVMELIDGQPIDAYVAARDLSVAEIVDLFIDIVGAVAFAHNRLIVHRDIKPSNVLVNSEGQPKLLDFGIAKPLDSDAKSLTTAYPLTPQSASPEQLLGQEITTGSDIYQLGLLLAQLLLGEPVIRQRSISDAIQRAAEAKPISLGHEQRRKLPRELGLIIEQCLRPRADERYSGANALRADLLAYRTGFPVSALGQGLGYRFGKLLARNKATAITAAVAIVAAVAGASWYTWQLADARDAALASQQRAETEAAAAELARAESEAVIDFLTRMLAAADPDKEGRDVRVVEVVEQAAEALETDLPDQPLVRARLHGEIGETFQQLGFWDEAEAQHRAKLAIYDQLGEEKHPGRAEVHFELSWLLREKGDLDAALASARLALDLRRELFGKEDPATLRTMTAYATLLVEDTDYDLAERILLESIELNRRVVGPEHAATSSAMASLARMYTAMGRYDEAAARYKEVLDIDVRTRGEENLNTLVTMGNWLEALNKSGRKAEALAGRRRQLELMTRLVGEEHPYTYITKVNMAMAFESTPENFAEREALIKSAIEGHEKLTHAEHPRVILARHNLGKIYRLHGRYDQAVSVHEGNLPVIRAVMGEDSPRTMYSIGDYAASLCHAGRIDDAMRLFDEFAADAPTVLGTNHPQYTDYMNERERCANGT